MTFTTFADLERADETPLFYVEPIPARPDDKAKWPEHYRQSAFVTYLRKKAPAIQAFSIANERRCGTFHGQKLKQAGLTPGVPDVCCLWDGGMAFCEFKGFDARGTAGKLSIQQVETCNRIHRNGHPVGCFYTATAALDWLRGLGAPLV